jgi:hypothetical protein
MPWLRPCTSTDIIIARLGWFVNHRMSGRVDEVSERTGIARATIRRYMEHCPDRIAEGGAGPQRLPLLVRILEATDINPAKLACAVQYAMDTGTFWRIVTSKLCAETAVALQARAAEPVKVEVPLLRLDDLVQLEDAEVAAGGLRQTRMTVEKLQTRLASYLDERLRGRIEEISSETGVPPTTLRRYCETTSQPHGGIGPQNIRAFCDILYALKVSPARLMVAACYGADDTTFHLLMNSTLYAEETLQFRTVCERGQRVASNLHELDDGGAPTAGGRFALRGWFDPVLPRYA